MVPFIRNRSDMLSRFGEARAVLAKLGDSLTPPSQVGTRLSATNCRVVARCLESVRLLNDDAHEAAALEAFARLPSFVDDGEVLRRLALQDRTASLHSWLAYSDAMLQGYLLAGNPQVFEDGLAMLLQAIKKFESAVPGLLRVDAHGVLPAPLAGSPEIVDNGTESAMAQAIRLYQAYGALAQGRTEGQALLAKLEAALKACAPLVKEANVGTAGLFCARLIGLNQSYGFAVGPKAVELATRAKRLRPVQFWFPALGSVRPDLQRLAPGTYWMNNGRVEGPLSQDEILSRVPDALNPESSGQKKDTPSNRR